MGGLKVNRFQREIPLGYHLLAGCTARPNIAGWAISPGFKQSNGLPIYSDGAFVDVDYWFFLWQTLGKYYKCYNLGLFVYEKICVMKIK